MLMQAEVIPIAVATAGRAAPIGALVIKPGIEAGPFLLYGRRRGSWVIGGWDGRMWGDEDGLPIEPIFWCPMPEIPVDGS